MTCTAIAFYSQGDAGYNHKNKAVVRKIYYITIKIN